MIRQTAALALILALGLPVPAFALRASNAGQTGSATSQELSQMLAGGLEENGENGKTDTLTALLGPLILEWLPLDPINPDRQALTHLEAHLMAFRAARHTVTPPESQTITISPVPYKPITFQKLTVPVPHVVSAFWEPGLGGRIYFERPGGEVVKYSVDAYRGISADGMRRPTYAELLLRAPKLETARGDPDELLFRALERGLQLDPDQPATDALHEVERLYALIRTRGLFIVASPDGTYPLKPKAFRAVSLLLTRLSPRLPHLVQIFWEPGLGPRLYLIRPTRTVGYAVERSMLVIGRPVWRKPVIEAESLDAARRDPRERLEKLLREAMVAWPMATELATRRRLEARFAEFTRHGYTAPFSPSGTFTISPLPGHELVFHNRVTARRHDPSLATLHYHLQLMLEPDRGPRVYFVQSGDVLGFSVEPYREALAMGPLPPKISARLLVRAPDMSIARGDPKRRLERLVTDAVVLEPSLVNDQTLGVLTAQCEAFGDEAFMIRATSQGEYDLEPAAERRLIVRGLMPHESYIVQPVWEPGLGPYLYFIHRTHVVVYAVSRYRQALGTDAVTYVYARWVTRAPDFATAQRRLLFFEQQHGAVSVVLEMLPDPAVLDRLLARTADDPSENAGVQDLRDRVKAALQGLDYTAAQIETIMTAGSLVFSGMSIEDALFEAGVPAARQAWFIEQWTQVLPARLRGLAAGMEELDQIRALREAREVLEAGRLEETTQEKEVDAALKPLFEPVRPGFIRAIEGKILVFVSPSLLKPSVDVQGLSSAMQRIPVILGSKVQLTVTKDFLEAATAKAQGISVFRIVDGRLRVEPGPWGIVVADRLPQQHLPPAALVPLMVQGLSFFPRGVTSVSAEHYLELDITLPEAFDALDRYL